MILVSDNLNGRLELRNIIRHSSLRNIRKRRNEPDVDRRHSSLMALPLGPPYSLRPQIMHTPMFRRRCALCIRELGKSKA
jgi:hypothetical protein